MVTRLRAQPPPPVPQRGPQRKEEEGSEGGGESEGKESQEKEETEEDTEMKEGDEEEKEETPAKPTPSPPPPTPIPAPTPAPKPPTPIPTNERPKTPPPAFMAVAKDGNWIDSLAAMDQKTAFWEDIVQVRSCRWTETVKEMKAFEEDNRRVREHREQWEGRWEKMTWRDALGLSEAEKDMARFFSKRKIGELDKQCWLVENKMAILAKGQIFRIRMGEIVRIDWEKGVASGWRQ